MVGSVCAQVWVQLHEADLTFTQPYFPSTAELKHITSFGPILFLIFFFFFLMLVTFSEVFIEIVTILLLLYVFIF